MPKLIDIYITNPSLKIAREISKKLLQKRLIACANIFPVSSLYWWKGKIVDTKEFAMLLKTTDKNFNAIKKLVEKIHPYKVPGITKIFVRPNQKSAKWITDETR